MATDSERKILAELKERARLQTEINSGLEGYIKGLETVKTLNQTIKANEKIRQKIQKEIDDAVRNGLAAEEAKQREILRLLNQQDDKLKDQRDKYAEIVKEAKNIQMTLAKAGALAAKGLVKTMANLPGIIQNSTSKLKGLFDMDKSIKTAALQMGILSKQSNSFRDNIKNAAMDTNDFGVGIQELAEMQASYNENLGRNVVMSKQQLKDISLLAKATGLGADGAAQMAAELDSQGLSASRTKDFIEQTMNDSHKMGLNATKVVKNIQQNIKMLNKYSFRNGTKGLGKMAETAARLGVDMETVGNMSEKLFNLEGAVDMSAQLQVMGGEWAKLADPFKLMYLGREDVNTLLEKMGEAAASSFHFDEGEFKISALEIQRLKQIAEQTGVEYDKLAEAGKNAKKFAMIKSQITVDFKDPEMQKFIENTATLDKNGKATIQLESGPKLVSQLTGADSVALTKLAKEKASLEERVKASQTFDDKLTNLINMVKTAFLPIVEGINSVLGPLVDNITGPKGEKFKAGLINLGKSIGKMVAWGAGFIKGIAEFVLKFDPKTIFYAILGAKGLGMILDGAKWFANGLLLSQGFLAGTGGLTSGLGSSLATSFATIAGPLLATAIGGFLGFNKGKERAKREGYDDTKTGDAGGILGALAGGGVGWALGAALAPETLGLSLLIPAITAGVGAYFGSDAGKYQGDKMSTEYIDDGVVSFNQKDKFMKVNDSTMVAGTNVNGNKDLAKILSGGALNGIDSSKYGKKNNQQSMQAPSVSKVEFGEIKIKGSITLDSPGNPGQGANLLADEKSKALLVRELSPLIHSEVRRQSGKS